MPGVPQELIHKGEEWEPLKAHYVMRVLWSIEGEMIDAKNADYGRDWNIGLYDIVSPASMRKVERSSQTMVQGRAIKGNINHGYCALCPYASQNHRTLNNHVRLHFCTSMLCGMPDCWYGTHSAKNMWKHTAKHGLHTAEPVAVNPPQEEVVRVYTGTFPLHLLAPVLITDGSITDISTGPTFEFPEDVLEDQEVLELRRWSATDVVFISQSGYCKLNY